MKNVMLAANTQPKLDELQYPVLVSPKIDGVRGCVQEGKLVSRSLKDSLNRTVSMLLSDPLLEGFDGELTVQGSRWNDFNHNQSMFMTQTGSPKFIYWVFDDISQSDLTAKVRKASLERRIAAINASNLLMFELKYCAQHLCNNAEEVESLYSAFRDEGFEGAIIMDPDAKYKHGRSTLKQGIMLKLKPTEDDEATIIGMEELMHNDDAGNSKCIENLVPGGMMGAIKVRWNDKIFNIGTGFTFAQRKEMWDNIDKYLGQLVTFKYMELSKYGVPRCPVFKGIRSRDDV